MRLPLPGILHTRPHLSAALGMGIATGLLLPASWPLLTCLLTAWNVTVWSYLLLMARMMARADHHDIRRINHSLYSISSSNLPLFFLCHYRNSHDRGYQFNQLA